MYKKKPFVIVFVKVKSSIKKARGVKSSISCHPAAAAFLKVGKFSILVCTFGL